MTTQSRTTAEPILVVHVDRRISWSITGIAASLVALVGLIILVPSGHTALPFESVLTLNGAMGSKADFFSDQKVTRILLKHHIKLSVAASGSREVAVTDLTGYDFAVTSGQPAGDLIHRNRTRANRYSRVSRPFMSPLVFATYRPYAQALQRAGIVTPQATSGSRPLYYTIDMAGFLKLVDQQKHWDDPDVGIEHFGDRNTNEVLAQVSDPCISNRGESYVALLAYVLNHDAVPQGGEQADRLATTIKAILERQGMPLADPFQTFVTSEGSGITPLFIAYEHEYLAHQISYRAEKGRLDDNRVLLYPSPAAMAQPQFIALQEKGDRLGQLVSTDPELRQRAMELGFRLLAPHTQDPDVGQMSKFLKAQSLPVPNSGGDSTRAVLPTLEVIEQMLSRVAGCENALKK